MKTMNDLTTDISRAVAGGKNAVAALAADILGGGWQTTTDGRPLQNTLEKVEDARNDEAFEVLAAAQYWAGGWACWYINKN